MIRWGTQTGLAVANFPISGEPMPRAVIRAIAQVKAEAAAVNLAHGLIDGATAGAIVRAADEVLDGAFDDQFPVDVFQTGSGTSSNMNANEVIARLASLSLGATGKAKVSPNDHVNASQSSNDVFPTAIHLAATEAVVTELIPALEHLAVVLRAKADEFADVTDSVEDLV